MGQTPAVEPMGVTRRVKPRECRLRRKRDCALAGLSTLLVVAIGVTDATADTFPVIRVSRDLNGGDANQDSSAPSISNSRYVAFSSPATDLVDLYTNGLENVFVRDVLSGTTTLVSVDLAGGPADSKSEEPAITPDGRYVAFSSPAGDLVADDNNDERDVFVRDLATATTTRVSLDALGGDADGPSRKPSISGDGRYIAFFSFARDLQGADGGRGDVFVRDMVAGTTTLVSVDRNGGPSDGYSDHPSLSADGRYVAFDSNASDLVAGTGDAMNGWSDVFVRDLMDGTTHLVSVSLTGLVGADGSLGAVISGNGRFVAFSSGAFDLVSGDDNAVEDVFVRDLVTATTRRVSVDTQGNDADNRSATPSISGNGQFVAFMSSASDLVSGDTNGMFDVFVRGITTGATTRVSVNRTGGDPDDASLFPSISPAGTFVAFESRASNLIIDDGNGLTDIFRRRLL